MFAFFYWFFLFVVVCAVCGFAAYVYVSRKYSKARFSFQVLVSSALIFAMGLSTLPSLGPWQLLNAGLAGLLPGIFDAPVTTGEPSGADLVFAFFVITIPLWLILRFASGALKVWEGPSSQVEAVLAARGVENSLLQLALTKAAYILQQKQDPEINIENSILHRRLEDAPDTPDWINFTREILIASDRDFELGEDDWNLENKVWFGRKHVGMQQRNAKPLCLFPSDDIPSDNVVEALISRLTTSDPEMRNGILIICCRVDQDLDRSFVSQLGTSVRIVSQTSLIKSSLDFRGYWRDLIERYETSPIAGTKFSLEDFFISPYMTREAVNEAEIGSRVSSEKPELAVDVIADWLEDKTRSHLTIAGEFGQGKSSAILKYCRDWAVECQQGRALDRRIPLLVELRGRNPAAMSSAELLHLWGKRYGLSGDALLNLIKAGSAVVFFEGFDEVVNAGRSYDRLQHFNALWRFAFPRAKLAFTGRPNFFFDDLELRKLLRIDAASAPSGRPHTVHYSLSFLNLEQIKQVLRPFPKDRVLEIVQACEDFPSFSEIASRPSMLPAIGTLWPNIRSELKETGVLTSSTIVSHFIEMIYQRKQVEVEDDLAGRGIPLNQNYLLLPKKIKEYFTYGIAFQMAQKGMRNTISGPDLIDTITLLYEDLEAVFCAVESEEEYARFTTDLRARFEHYGNREKIDIIASEIRATGLFVMDPAGGPSNIQFPHKQYFEFTLAKVVQLLFENPEDAISKAIVGLSPMTNFWSVINREPEAALYLSEMVALKFDACFVLTHYERVSVRFNIFLSAVSNGLFGIAFFRRLFSRTTKAAPTDNDIPRHDYHFFFGAIFSAVRGGTPTASFLFGVMTSSMVAFLLAGGLSTGMIMGRDLEGFSRQILDNPLGTSLVVIGTSLMGAFMVLLMRRFSLALSRGFLFSIVTAKIALWLLMGFHRTGDFRFAVPFLGSRLIPEFALKAEWSEEFGSREIENFLKRLLMSRSPYLNDGVVD